MSNIYSKKRCLKKIEVLIFRVGVLYLSVSFEMWTNKINYGNQNVTFIVKGANTLE